MNRLLVSLAVLVTLLGFVFGDCEARAVGSERTAIEQVEDKVIHVTTLLQATPRMSFSYFTDNVLLASWLTVEADVEPHLGGKYELYWAPSDRENNSTIGCRITALAPDQLIAFQWRSPKQFKSFANSADPLTHVTVTFVPERPGTRVHLIHSGWRNSPEWEKARVWQERAWIDAFKQLERAVND